MNTEQLAVTFPLWGRVWEVVDVRPPWVHEDSGWVTIAFLRPVDWRDSDTVTIRGRERSVGSGIGVKAHARDKSRRYLDTSWGDLTTSNRADLMKAYLEAVPDFEWLTHEESVQKSLITATLVGENQASAAWRQIIPWEDSRHADLNADDVRRISEATVKAFAARMIRGH